MKTPTLSRLLLVMIVIGASLTNVKAQRVLLNESNGTALSIVSQDQLHLEMRNTISEFDYSTLNTPEGLFTTFHTHVNAFSGKVGTPRIPVIRKLIEIPLGATVKINNVTYTEETIDLGEMGVLYPAIPVQLPAEKGGGTPPPFQYDADAYQMDRYFGEKLVSVEVKGILRGQRLALVTIAPYAYNPAKNRMKVYSDVQFDLTFENADMAATMELKERTWSPHFQSDYTQVINAASFNLRKDPLSNNPITYVIISHPMFEDQLQEFIAWKQKKGYRVITGYTDDPEVGNTTTSIKAFIKGLYDNPQPGYTAPTYVLFVGDVGEVPSFAGSTGSHITDLYYCEYTNDHFPEIYYGRFSAQNTAQLQPQIDKTLMIEQYTMPDPSYLDEVVLVAGMDSGHGQKWGNGQINYGTENYFNEEHGITSHVYLYPQSGSSGPEIKQRINAGVAYVNYSAHCSQNGWQDPSFTVQEVHNLTNTDEYFLSIGNCCLSNAFDTQECFGEAMIRAENKASIGHIGGTNSTYWDEDYYWGVGVGTISEDPPAYEETTLGVYDCLFHEHDEAWADWCFTSGQIIFAGNRAVSESGSVRETYYWEIYSIMGDPSLAMYITVPEPITASYNGLIPLGTNTITVTTDPYAYVAISREGELFGATIADESGNAEVTIDPPITIPGPCDVVVTKQWGEPFFGEVNVASPEGPYVILNAFNIDDSNGNNNGLVDYNETVNFDITLKNFGNDDASNVSATITCNDPDITVTQNTHNFGSIASQNTASQLSAFTFEVAQTIEDRKQVEFLMDITDGNETWHSKIILKLHAPVLSIQKVNIDDTTTGNSNNTLDEGENANIVFTLSNEGSADIMDILGELSTTNTELTINNATATIEELPAEGTATLTFNVTVEDEVQSGTIVEMELLAASNGYSDTDEFITKIGIITEDFESGDFSAYNWTHSTYPWVIDETEVQEGLFSAKSGLISDSQSSELSISIEVLSENDSIKFYRKVSSEETYDLLKFYIDDVEIENWSGEEDWALVSYPILIGEHTLRWSYEKDFSVSNGLDCAWIDNITFPAMRIEVGTKEISRKEEAASMSIFPNPLQHSTHITYNLTEESGVSLSIYDVMGNLIEVIEHNASVQAGTHTKEFRGTGLQQGIYFCILKTNKQTITQRLIISK
ncbi:MAG: hypothetical protein CSA04_02235 [Bacteroidetes bacterium]|nr:MAG: hypothetical protein CSA04_02235 [Bacteroidota bacterium]